MKPNSHLSFTDMVQEIEISLHLSYILKLKYSHWNATLTHTRSTQTRQSPIPTSKCNTHKDTNFQMLPSLSKLSSWYFPKCAFSLCSFICIDCCIFIKNNANLSQTHTHTLTFSLLFPHIFRS